MIEKKSSPFLLILPSLCFLVFFFFVPSLYNVKNSFTDLSLLKLSSGGEFVGIKNYLKLIHDPKFWRAFKNTVIWLTAFTVLLRVLIGLPLALLFNSKILEKWKLSGIMRSLLLIPWATPPIVAVAIWKWMLDQQYGIINIILKNIGLIKNGIAFFGELSTVWPAITVIVIWNQLPFVIVSILAALQSIPGDLYEVAKIDGANSFQVFSRITLPLLFPVIRIIVILTTMWTFNNYLYVWLSTRGGPGDATNVLATYVYIEAFQNYRLGYASTIGIMMTVILLVGVFVYLPVITKRGEMG